VIDEPSTFDYGPQHQSLCGLNFNPGEGFGRPFGPARWAGDAIIAGYSRGKLYRTKLVKTPAGYVATSQIIAALNMLTVDACVSPRGDLVVAAHSGQPDWGSGPTGSGKLFQIAYATPGMPQPIAVWPASSTETHVAFDRPLSPEQARKLVQEAAAAAGKHIVAGERFESLRPGYQVVQDQLAADRSILPVLSSQLSADRRTLIIQTPRRDLALNYTLTLSAFDARAAWQVLTQHQKIDLAYALHGVEAKWSSGNEERRVWLPHFDEKVAREFTAGSAEHQDFWQALPSVGAVNLRAQLDLWQMLRPAVQPGSKLDFQLPVEEVVITFQSAGAFTLVASGMSQTASRESDGTFSARIKKLVPSDNWVPIELAFKDGASLRGLMASWHTAEDPRPRPLPLHRMLLPWAERDSKHALDPELTIPPQVAKANWLNGRRHFFGEKAACSTCHRIRGEGHLVGPDLSNLVHRDYQSVLKDITAPNATINPDHVSYVVETHEDEIVSGVLQRESPDSVTLAQPGGNILKIRRRQIRSMTPSSLSLMPEGIHAALGEEATSDLMRFLLTTPLEPAQLQAEVPITRSADELKFLKDVSATNATFQKHLNVLLVSGPKDHGPDEHDYPLWQTRWAKLLSLAENVSVSTASGFPSTEALQHADVVVFYSNNPGWSKSAAQQLEAFQKRGGGLVYVHFAVDGHNAVRELSDRIGLAWRGGASKFRHGPLNLSLDSKHPITKGFSELQLYDESYWDLEGDPSTISALATGIEAGQPRPLMWTRENGAGRVFVSIPGHYTWTFDDPAFRLILLRAICWTAHQPVERLSELATIGARMDLSTTHTK
jgi:putative heme-binding domain-containing protein